MLVVCVEKFSDKIGNVRPSRMIFGDGAAAFVIGVAPDGEQTDIEFMQTYASGPASQVNSIIWPNPEFDNNITVYGPEVKKLAGRYLEQMIGELTVLPDPDGVKASLLESIDLVAARIKEMAAFTIEQETKKAAQSLKEEVVGLATQMATDMIKEKATYADQQGLVEEYLKKVVETH